MFVLYFIVYGGQRISYPSLPMCHVLQQTGERFQNILCSNMGFFVASDWVVWRLVWEIRRPGYKFSRPLLQYIGYQCVPQRDALEMAPEIEWRTKKWQSHFHQQPHSGLEPTRWVTRWVIKMWRIIFVQCIKMWPIIFVQCIKMWPIIFVQCIKMWPIIFVQCIKMWPIIFVQCIKIWPLIFVQCIKMWPIIFVQCIKMWPIIFVQCIKIWPLIFVQCIKMWPIIFVQCIKIVNNYFCTMY